MEKHNFIVYAIDDKWEACHDVHELYDDEAQAALESFVEKRQLFHGYIQRDGFTVAIVMDTGAIAWKEQKIWDRAVQEAIWKEQEALNDSGNQEYIDAEVEEIGEDNSVGEQDTV